MELMMCLGCGGRPGLSQRPETRRKRAAGNAGQEAGAGAEAEAGAGEAVAAAGLGCYRQCKRRPATTAPMFL